MKNIKYFIFFYSIFLFGVAHGGTDYELKESRKCSSIFYYFEKKYKLPTNSLHSISLHETAKKHSYHDISLVWPWTVMNNKLGKSYHFRNRQEAINYVRAQFKVGNNNLDVGCMQINLKHHPDAFKSLDQAFAPNLNVAYGAYFLSENLKKLGSIDKAIGRYHSATGHLAQKYHLRVSKINEDMRQYKYNLKRYVTANSQKRNARDHY
jgi:soluble lytic murein transglycosylase-like protein